MTIATVKKTRADKCWQRCGEKGLFYTVGGMELGVSVMQNSIEVPEKLEVAVPYDPAVSH